MSKCGRACIFDGAEWCGRAQERVWPQKGGVEKGPGSVCHSRAGCTTLENRLPGQNMELCRARTTQERRAREKRQWEMEVPRRRRAPTKTGRRQFQRRHTEQKIILCTYTSSAAAAHTQLVVFSLSLFKLYRSRTTGKKCTSSFSEQRRWRPFLFLPPQTPIIDRL